MNNQLATQKLENLINRYPTILPMKDVINEAYEIILNSIINGRKILVCGNGGSAADSDHIVGELMKSFCAKRPIDEKLKETLISSSPPYGKKLADNLEGAIPAINLTQHTALSTAYSNDKNPALIFAQQVLGYGNKGDVLIAISTSGNSENVVLAAIVAKAKGMKIVSLTGEGKAKLDDLSDSAIKVPAKETFMIQEYHLPIYHTLCLMLESSLWPDSSIEKS